MNIKLLTVQANQAMREKNFSTALEFYKKARDLLASKAFDANIAICEKKINQTKPIEDNISIQMESLPTSVEKNKICLIRIIGNDLPGLHNPMQSINNLEFILKNEPNDDDIEKIFIINRIISIEKKNKIIKILGKYSKKYTEIPFDPSEYLKISWDTQDLPDQNYWEEKKRTEWDYLCHERAKRKSKNAYLMNNNGARNAAIELGISLGYDWVLPFDGNCFLSSAQISELKNSIRKLKHETKYLIIPMERCIENTTDLAYKKSDSPTEEPQVCFHRTAKLRFDENRVYGNQPKVDLFKRLNIPGVWDKWKFEYPWKLMAFEKCTDKSEAWAYASSVFRLASGNSEATKDANNRANTRAKAIINFLDTVYKYCEDCKKNKSQIDFLYWMQSTAALSYKHPERLDVNKFFDKIYVVSLEKQIEKRLKVQKQLDDYGLHHEVVKATNGYEGKVLSHYERYTKTPIGELKYFKEYAFIEKRRKIKLIESPGAMGYIYTYIEIVEQAKKHGYKNILILEDDIILCHNFVDRLKSFLAKLPRSWKILNLGASQYQWDSFDYMEALENGYYKPRIIESKGSFAIALNEAVFDELLENQKKFEAAFDNIPLNVIYEKYQGECFNVFPYLVMPDVSVSTIRGNRDQYEHANRMKWWIGDFVYPQKKINIGLILTSSNNIKYLKDKKVIENSPINLSFFFIHENGVLPLHALDTLAEGYQKELPDHALKDLNISVDFLFEVALEHCLTIESIIHAVECCFKSENLSEKNLSRKFLDHKKIIKNRVSVIIPTYKRPEKLSKAIESVLSQKYKNIELIVVDDNGKGSEFEEETKSIITAYQSKYPNRILRYVQHEVNANGATARNSGILRSTGEYIAFLDDDDVYLPGRIFKCLNALKGWNNDCGGIYCGFIGWNSNQLDANRFATGDLSKNLLSLDYLSHYLHTNTATYKRSAVFRLNGFDSSYKRHQDLEFNIRFFQEYDIAAFEECLVKLLPQKSAIDNKIYGIELFSLKKKFLNQFSTIIDNFDADTKSEIYFKNWNEVLRYTKDLNNLIGFIKNDFKNGATQIFLNSGC